MSLHAGLLGADTADASSGSSSTATPAAQAASSGLIPTLQWLQQQHPHRCLTASMGAWLLLTELIATSGPRPPAADAAGSTAAAPGASAQPPQHFPASGAALLPLGQVLQAYLDQAYRNMARPPAVPLPQAAGGSATSGRTSGAGTPVRRMSSREQMDSSSPNTSPTPGKRRSITPLMAAAAVAAAEDGCPSPVGGEGKAAAEAADADAIIKGFSHAVSLSDDPNTAVFKHLLVLLHSLQIQLLVLAAALRPSEGPDDQDGSLAAAAAPDEGGLQLPHASNCQLLALANAWLLQQSESPAGAAAAAAAAAGGREYEHQSLLPAPALAMEALKETGMDSLAAVQQLVELCAKALQLDCIKYVHALQQRQRQQQKAAAGEGSSSGGSSADDAKNSSRNGLDSLDTCQVYRLLLDAVCLQQACGAAVSEETLTAVALAARCSTRAQVQQLLQQRGSQLLRAMHKYVQQEPMQQQHQAGAEAGDKAEGSANGSSAAAADTWEAGLQDLSLARRCVACAGVLMEICSSGRMRIGECCGTGTWALFSCAVGW